MSERKIAFTFGALAPSIRKQLKEQGLKPMPSKKLTDLWDKLQHSITLLYIQNFIPESIKDKCYDKLIEKIMKELNK